jgi:hypothetical protein
MSYRIQIRPLLLTEGEFKSHLEYIHFHVSLNGIDVGHWSELNQGQIPDSLGRLVGRLQAIECDLELRRGVTVDVPGEYTEESGCSR